jgi:hypothetical protein
MLKGRIIRKEKGRIIKKGQGRIKRKPGFPLKEG